MTSRQMYEAVLIEMNKVEAPSMLLEDFNYFINKAIYQYIHKKYNIYDVNQQSTDDIRVLKSTAILTPKTILNAYGESANSSSLYGNVSEFDLPVDYLHMLNCICNFVVLENFKCYDKGYDVQFPARRLTSDMWSQIINNFYMRPMYKRPYYFIHNVNNPERQYVDGQQYDGVNYPTSSMIDKEPSSTITVLGQSQSNIERSRAIRYGNVAPVRLEVRWGKDDSIFKLDKIYVDYIKAPQNVRLTQQELDITEDTSQVLEFPDYVCQEIIKELVALMMENASDPRLQTNLPINQAIASPVPQSQ